MNKQKGESTSQNKNKKQEKDKNTETNKETNREDRIKGLEEEIKRKDQEISELIEQIKRIQAEFDNYRKRVEKQKAELEATVLKDFVKDILPIVDSFEIALKDEKQGKEFRKGVELIFAQLHSYLKKLGVEQIEAKGKFNPNLHEVLIMEESDKPENEILEELQKGYTLKGKLLRTSKVKVSKGKKR